jgi:hypothetical protein
MSAFANLPISRKLMAAFAASGTYSDGTANSIPILGSMANARRQYRLTGVKQPNVGALITVGDDPVSDR